MKKKKEESFELTVKGFLQSELGKSDGSKLNDSLELYMRRHYAKKGYAVIVLEDEGLMFGIAEKK